MAVKSGSQLHGDSPFQLCLCGQISNTLINFLRLPAFEQSLMPSSHSVVRTRLIANVHDSDRFDDRTSGRSGNRAKPDFENPPKRGRPSRFGSREDSTRRVTAPQGPPGNARREESSVFVDESVDTLRRSNTGHQELAGTPEARSGHARPGWCFLRSPWRCLHYRSRAKWQ